MVPARPARSPLDAFLGETDASGEPRITVRQLAEDLGVHYQVVATWRRGLPVPAKRRQALADALTGRLGRPVSVGEIST